MSNISTLQSFSFEELYHYDEDDRYMFIFVTRDQLEQLADGYLESSDAIEAVDDTQEWLRFKKESLLEQGKVFIAIFQRRHLVEAGFIEPSYVQNKSEEDWDKKIDDNIVELRAIGRVVIEPVGYGSMFPSRGKRDEGQGFNILSGHGQLNGNI